jgi:hypothetical protein
MNARDSARTVIHEAKPWLQKVARLGFAAKGTVYIVVGFLAIKAAMGTGGQTTNSAGALHEIASKPLGEALLGIIAVGLVGYALWKLIQCFTDPEHVGRGVKGSAKRVGYGVSGLLHIALAITAARLAMGDPGTGSGGEAAATQDWTAWLLAQPFGRWLVGLVGAAVIGAGISQFVKGYTAKFLRKLKLGEMSPTEETWAMRLGRLGFTARGVVFALIGWFFVQAAWQYDSQAAGGLTQALQTIASKPHGAWMLGVTAAGLLAYGIFAWVMARYRYVHVE